MKILKKILLFDEDLTTTENIVQLFYRIFTFLVPGGIVLWNLLIEKLIDSNVSVVAKIGCAGIFALIVIILIGIHFLKKHFTRTISKINDKILLCTDETKKKELIQKRRKVEKWQEIFNNACFLAPFVIAYFLVIMIENAMISLRGTLLIIVLSMGAGFGFNVFLRNLIAKR